MVVVLGDQIGLGPKSHKARAFTEAVPSHSTQVKSMSITARLIFKGKARLKFKDTERRFCISEMPVQWAPKNPKL